MFINITLHYKVTKLEILIANHIYWERIGYSLDSE